MKGSLLGMLAGCLAGLLIGCSADEPVDTSDPRVKDIAFETALAVRAWASGGPAGLYPYMGVAVKSICSEAEFVADLAGDTQPQSYEQLRGVEFGENAARIKITVLTTKGEAKMTWTYNLQRDAHWVPIEVPGLEKCRP